MCGYDPFYWYEKDLDEEYLQRTGENNMKGFQQAQAEYESKMYAPYDEGGALYSEDEKEDEDTNFQTYMNKLTAFNNQGY